MEKQYYDSFCSYVASYLCTMNLHTRKLHYKNVCAIQGAPVRGQKKKMAMIIHARDEGEDIYTSPECS